MNAVMKETVRTLQICRTVRIVAVVGFFALLGLECSAAAQEPCAPDVTLRRLELRVQDQPGVWFHIEVARCMLRDLEMALIVREQLRLRDEQVVLLNAQVQDLRAAVSAGREAEERATGALEAAVRRARQAELDRDVWYRSPFLWGLSGLLVGGAAVLAAVLL